MKTKKEEPVLKPCPFCGGSDIEFTFEETYSVDSSYWVFGCKQCGACFLADGAEDAENWQRWNTRKGEK